MGNRIAEIRNKKGMTQKELAQALNVTQQTVWYYENGQRDVKASVLVAMSDVLGCTVSELLGLESTPGIISAKRSPSRELPIVGRIAAGAAREAIEQAGEYMQVTEDTYIKHPNAFWLVVSGNSMNRILPDGTLALIDPDEEVKNGDVAALFVNGDDVTIKRVYFDGTSVSLVPESYDTEYLVKTIDESSPDAPLVRMIGKVVGYTSPAGWRP